MQLKHTYARVCMRYNLQKKRIYIYIYIYIYICTSTKQDIFYWSTTSHFPARSSKCTGSLWDRSAIYRSNIDTRKNECTRHLIDPRALSDRRNLIRRNCGTRSRRHIATRNFLFEWPCNFVERGRVSACITLGISRPAIFVDDPCEEAIWRWKFQSHQSWKRKSHLAVKRNACESEAAHVSNIRFASTSCCDSLRANQVRFTERRPEVP